MLYLLLGLAIFRDYGLSWDESDHRLTGVINWDYANGNDSGLLEHPGRFAGPAFELVMVGLERALRLDYSSNSAAVFRLFHLLTFGMFFAGQICFYFLCRELFGDWRYALAACLAMILSPRIFADSFYNPRDIPFMSVFTIGIYTLWRFVERRSVRSALAHGVCCGFAIGVRIMGLMLPALTIVMLGADFLSRRPVADRRGLRAGLPAYFLSCAVCTVLFWPILWAAPLDNLVAAFRETSHFPWDGTVLYLGRIMLARDVPWHYFFVWVAVTTPLSFVALFLVGIGRGLWSALADPRRFLALDRRKLLVALWLAVPPLMVIALKSVTYDAWRHLFFVYPAFVVAAVSGLKALLDPLASIRRPVRLAALWIIVGLLSLDAAGVVRFMVRNHPYQNVYFNRLAGESMAVVKSRFEMDYWGLTYKRALEHILANDRSPSLRVLVNTEAGVYSSYYLSLAERQRLTFVTDIRDADYFVSNYRYHQEEYDVGGREVYAVTVGDAKIVVVYRL